MDDPASHPNELHAAAGPYQTERQARESVRHILDSPPGAGAWRDGSLRLLEAACGAAGAELGAYDHQVLVWLAGLEPQICAVIAGLIRRARQPGAREVLLGEPGVAQPGGGWISGPSS